MFLCFEFLLYFMCYSFRIFLPSCIFVIGLVYSAILHIIRLFLFLHDSQLGDFARVSQIKNKHTDSEVHYTQFNCAWTIEELSIIENI